MAWTQDTIIQTLRACGGAADDPAFRLALSGLLERADLRPPALPPSAVLIVRRLQDPLPTRLAPHRGALRADVAWERAVQQALADLHHRAARPVQGCLPPEADAVLFADKAEMLACLALDLSRGTAPLRWWWRVPLHRLSAATMPERLSALLCEEVLYTPAVFHQLAAWHQAAPVLEALSPEQAGRVLATVRAAFREADGDVPEPLPEQILRRSQEASAPTRLLEGLDPPEAAHTSAAAHTLEAAHTPAAARSPTQEPTGADGDGTSPTGAAAGEVAVKTGALFEDGVDTRLGGVLYLINLMTYLGLPDCFEATWRLASEVGPWGVLEALGRALLGPPALGDDPIWRALAVLDGRDPGTLPGGSFRGGDDFCLSPSWLDPVDGTASEAYSWAARGGRLRLWSDKGYLVADCRRAARAPSVQAKEILTARLTTCRLARKSFASAPVAVLEETPAGSLPLARWTALVLPYVRYRLALALHLDPADGAALAESLLLLPGRLYLSSSHVDLVLPLEAASTTVRIAGLDRDPGWMPAFGRVVLFHFQ